MIQTLDHCEYQMELDKEGNCINFELVNTVYGPPSYKIKSIREVFKEDPPTLPINLKGNTNEKS